jgi:hypothetical protein
MNQRTPCAPTGVFQHYPPEAVISGRFAPAVVTFHELNAWNALIKLQGSLDPFLPREEYANARFAPQAAIRNQME